MRRLLAFVTVLLAAGCVSPTHRADYTETIRGSTVPFDMVWIEDGDFWIGRHEVTWDEYLLYCSFELDEPIPPGADAVSRPSKPLDSMPYDREWGLGRRPAVGMSRNAAEHYCRWLSGNTGRTYRLPTETEWALACGAAGTPIEDHAWCAENSSGMTREVGGRAPNGRGLHDMLGNLWEYCGNPYKPSDPGRAVLRGGSWRDPADAIDPDRRLRFDKDWILADPNVPPGVWWVPDGDHLGFRILRPVVPPEE